MKNILLLILMLSVKLSAQSCFTGNWFYIDSTSVYREIYFSSNYYTLCRADHLISYTYTYELENDELLIYIDDIVSRHKYYCEDGYLYLWIDGKFNKLTKIPIEINDFYSIKVGEYELYGKFIEEFAKRSKLFYVYSKYYN